MQFVSVAIVHPTQNPRTRALATANWRRKVLSAEKIRLYISRIESFVEPAMVKYRMEETKESLR